MAKTLAVLLAAACGFLLTGCVSVDGDTHPAHGAASPQPSTDAARYGAGELTCYPYDGTEGTAVCDSYRLPWTYLKEGSAMHLRPGQPIRLANPKTDRICSISFFVTSANGTKWAVTGNECAVKKGVTAATYDGFRIGEVDKLLVQPNSVTADKFSMPAIKLDPSVAVHPTIAGTTTALPNMIVHAEGATTQQERQLQSDVRELGYTPRTQTPLPQPGEQGAPVLVDGQRLVGVISAVNRVSLIADILAALPTLDPTARLETTS